MKLEVLKVKTKDNHEDYVMLKRFISWLKKINPFKKPTPLPPVEPTPVVWEPVPEDQEDPSKMVYDMASSIMAQSVVEISGSRNNELIVEMHKVVSGTGHPDETPWCAAFVGYVLDKCGLPHTGSLVARSYTDYGNPVPIESAKKGDIVVFKRGNSSWKGHVGFLHEFKDSYIKVLGGNQDNSVSIKSYPVRDFLGARTYRVKGPDILGVEPLWKGKGYSERAGIIIKEFGLAELNPADIKNYFPGYAGASLLKRVEFWTFFLSCMATKESGLNPATKFKESFSDSNGKRVISRGLFQLSVESVNGYKRFGIEPTATVNLLHDPFYNLTSAMVILRRWIESDGVIASKTSPWRGGARYWSVLRNNSNHKWIKEKCLESFGN